MNTHTLPGWRRLTAALLILVAAGGPLAAAPAATAQEPPPATITEGSLVWGFKASWRSYIADGLAENVGITTPSGGASVDDAGILTFPVTAGSYDPATGTTQVDFGGQVHYQKYPPAEGSFPPDYDGPEDIYLLDVTMANPQVTISGDEQVLTMEMVSRNLTTWDLVDYGRVALAGLDTGGNTPVVADGVTSWTGVQANITELAANDVFFGQYRPGAALDPVSFTYTGPGGPPAGEVWSEPGSTRLADPQVSTIPLPPGLSSGGNYANRVVDQQRQLVHYVTTEFGAGTRQVSLRAFDLATMTPVGEPYRFPVDAFMPNLAFFDSTDGRIFLQSERYGIDVVESYLRWDPEGQRYVAGASTVPIQGTRGRATGFWDPVGERAVSIERRVPDGAGDRDFDEHDWYLHTYTEQPDGTWATDSHPLPSAPPGLNQSWYQDSFAQPSVVAVATDGSIILPRKRIYAEEGATPPTAPGVQRLVIGDETVTVAEVAGTGIGNGVGFGAAHAGPDGQVTLVRNADLGLAPPRPALVQGLQVTADGPVALVGGRVDLGDMPAYGGAIAIDPVDGTVWVVGGRTKDLAAVRDGRLISRQYFPSLHTDDAAVTVGPDHTVYAQTMEGADLTTFGFGRFERLGFSPTVTAQPESATASLAAGQASAPVSFSAAAEGDSAPEVRWQAAPAGSTTFADLDGQTSPTLTLDATRADDGRRFRAVFSNAAGALPSDVVTLTVQFPPSVQVQPADLTVTAGADALLQVGYAGNPTPDVQWQRDDRGAWVDVPGGSDGFLTVADATPAMSGTRYRARLSNSVGTVYSDTATLTVTEGADDPLTVTGGELEWGVRASFRNYINGPIARGSVAVSDGATTTAAGTYAFPAESGSVGGGDVAAGFGGAVRFTGHEGVGTPPGVPALDLRISDIRIEVAGDGGTLVADVVSRGLADGQLTTYDDVAFADLDLTGVTPTEVDGGQRWADVAATLTAEGVPAFANFYEAGSDLDPLTFTLLLAEPEPTPTPDPTPGLEPEPDPGDEPVRSAPDRPDESSDPTTPGSPTAPPSPPDGPGSPDDPDPRDPATDPQAPSGDSDPEPGPQDPVLLRVAGDDRIATAAALSRATFDPGVPVAFVATPGDFADALSAGPAAAELGGPVLLAGDDLPAPTAEELARLEPGRIVVVGGEVAVSDEVADQLTGLTSGAVDRLGGPDRFATSAAVSAAVFDPGVPVFTATGANFPDALTGGVAAGVAGGPVLLVGDDVPPATLTELNRLRPDQVTVLGGVHAVHAAVEQQLSTGGADVRRLAGDNRFATAAAIAAATFPDGADTAYIATGAAFADALAGTPVAALAQAPMLLVTADDVPAATAAELDRIEPQRMVVLGGETAVGGQVADDLERHRAPR